MIGIILAAGQGIRLESVLPGKPKCLLEFGEKSLIEHQIASLMGAGIKKVAIVVGYEHQQIRNHLQNRNDIDITYIVNDIYDKTNTIYSLWLARKYFKEDFIYFNADVLFDYRVISRICDGSIHSTLACQKGLCGEEEVKVVVEKGRIVKIGKKIEPALCYGEFIGIARFSKEDNIRFGEILDECIKDESTWNNFFEYAVDFLGKDRILKEIDISDLPATEIDFPEDLEYARKEVFPMLFLETGEDGNI